MNPDESFGAGDGAAHEAGEDVIRLNADAPPVPVPHGYVGPVYMPSTGRLVWWTGRVAIGLRHRPSERGDAMASQSACWLQRVVLGKAWRGAASAR